MNNIKVHMNLYVLFLLFLGCLIPMKGYAWGRDRVIVYQVSANAGKQPQLSFLEAFRNIKASILKVKYDDNSVPGDVLVTGDGFSFTINGGAFSHRFDESQELSVYYYPAGQYQIKEYTNGIVQWYVQGDAQNFVDAVLAMNYYTSKNFLADDTSSFADFQQKARDWRALAQKPAIPEEARRFRVLADDAVQNKDFSDAADYYEQGLAIDPMWPAGQFNAALIFAELKFYPMAVMHMERYLALKPNAKDARDYQDKIYIWEEKAAGDGSTSGNSNVPSAQPTASLSSGGLEQQFLQNAGTR
jgi:tetratricopeptide (TPR) repeat protein